jgi:geranylgeranyl transferase type-2 subunit beta
MTSSAYLDMLDELLGPGITGLSERFTAAQVRFVASCQQSDGGFGGRQGSSDSYFTDFALRTLSWLAPGHAAFDRAAGYVARLRCLPGSIVECFNLLNARRLLERHCAGIADGAAWKQEPLIEWLREQLLPSGGFARFAADERVSAYHTFLGSLCFQLLGVDMPAIVDAIHAIDALNRPDGGYAELADQPASQTSGTAAAVAFLVMHDALPPERTAHTARFLAEMQSADGGLKPHAAVAAGDLLSTFTGLLTLSSLGGFHEIDAASVARFLQRTAHPGGGFLACDGDDMPDVEYTYYGVGTLALLQVLAAAE